ncbi:MAG TPA: sialidase family protein [Candidatus Dormibacteraeota bacterium]
MARSKRWLLWLVVAVTASLLPGPAAAATTQSDSTFARSYSSKTANVVATTQKTSCYTPLVPYALNQGPAEGYSGESACAGAATTGEQQSGYPTQQGTNPGYPAATPMLVKGHSESNIAVDPTNPNHIIGTSKWFVSPEGYNHLLGFYESFDGGTTFSVQGHIPGFEGWTDNTDPVGAFDANGNFYTFVLGYQFTYNSDGSHYFHTNQNEEPNPSVAAEVVGVAVRPHGATQATDWITNHNGQLDLVASYDQFGREPDKQWLTIDTNATLPNGQPNPNFGNVYLMWVVFNYIGSKPFFSVARANPDGTHSDWSAPEVLPTANSTSGDTYLLPHVTPDGTVWTTVANFPARDHFSTGGIFIDYSRDGGKTWTGALPVTPAQDVVLAPYCCYSNTNTRSGILQSFATGLVATASGTYPLYVAWEDYSTGFSNIFITASTDGGQSWTPPLKVNDNTNPSVDEFQPNLAAAASGTVAVAFYDRRLPCPSAGSSEAAILGLALDTNNPRYSGSLPPYGAANYCANTAVQFYDAALNPKGSNTRLSAHGFDPELNAALYSRGTNIAKGFIGDYFGAAFAGNTLVTTSVTTNNADGSNPSFRQQQLVTATAAP